MNKRLGQLAIVWLSVCCNACNGNPIQSPSPKPSPYVTGYGPTSVYPERDTPLASASAELQRAWRDKILLTIPSRHIFDVPKVPHIINGTPGILNDADAAKWAGAAYQTQTLVGWAESKQEITLVDAIGFPLRHSMTTPAFAAALSAGTISDPACDVFPATLAIYPIDAASLKYFEGLGETVSRATYLIAETFTGPCQVTSEDAGKHKTVISSFTTRTEVVAGYLSNDPALGTVLIPDATGDCSALAAPRPQCT